MAAIVSEQTVAWCLQGIAIAFFAYMAQLFVRQKSIIFQSSREVLSPPPSLAKHVERIWLELPDGKIHAWWVASTPESNRAVLLLPGAIGNFSHEILTMEFVRSLGASVLALDYPGYGMSQGKPSERGVYSAAERGWQFLTRDKGFSPGQILIWGRSLGGVAALRLAADIPCRGLVVHNGFASIPDVAAARYPFFPVRPFCLLRFNARPAARRVSCPTLFIHARQDEAIPLRLGKRCFELISAPKQFLEVPGTHGGGAWAQITAVRSRLEDLWSGQAACWN